MRSAIGKSDQRRHSPCIQTKWISSEGSAIGGRRKQLLEEACVGYGKSNWATLTCPRQNQSCAGIDFRTFSQS